MLVPRPVFDPPFNVVRMSHVVYTVPDLSRSRAFYVDLLGMQITGETKDALYLRGMEERSHHCMVLKRGEHAVVDAMSFRLFADEDVDKAARFFEKRGLPVRWTDQPFQGRTFRTVDTQGMPLEFHHRMDRLPPIHQQYQLYRGA
jgi:catechol 2,3-dioxygenase